MDLKSTDDSDLVKYELINLRNGTSRFSNSKCYWTLMYIDEELSASCIYFYSIPFTIRGDVRIALSNTIPDFKEIIKSDQQQISEVT